MHMDKLGMVCFLFGDSADKNNILGIDLRSQLFTQFAY